MILPEAPPADPDGITILSFKCCCYSEFETKLEFPKVGGGFAKICGAVKFNSNQETIVLAKI